nr:DUF4157 domain-containing protein [uncultured Fluviicola sp.]
MKANKSNITGEKQNSTIQSKARNQAHEGSILQAYKKGTAQLQSADEEEPVQGKFETAQLASEEDEEPAQRQENKTGLPDNLKSGVENLSGHSLDDVKVHYNSSQPASLQAHAYAQGTDIHVAPGQEKHLPHEAWHVVQQKQGRVKPTRQLKGKTNINDDQGLEKEADVMGAKAMQLQAINQTELKTTHSNSKTAQLEDAAYGETSVHWDTATLGGDKVGIKMDAKKLKKSSISKVDNLKGSPPGSGQQKGLMGYLPTNPKLPTTKKYIKGHLLNHNIGGPGKDFNMYPITASANKAHLMGIETQVKNWVSSGDTVDYSVEVNQISNTLDSVSAGSKAGTVTASFVCNASNGSESISTEIPSQLDFKSTPQEPSSVLVDLGMKGIFRCLYDYAVEENDPTDLIWDVAVKVAEHLKADRDEMFDILTSVVIFDGVEDLPPEAFLTLKKHVEFLTTASFKIEK